MRGLPTVLITVVPEESALMRPPRALYPSGFRLGCSLGRQPELQRKVLLDALNLLVGPPDPGKTREVRYPESGGA
jgi:hypothetical protein